MKKVFLVIFPVLFLFSCIKEDNFPSVETISSGSMWNLQIGSSHADVYAQLQKLGEKKDFNAVEVINQPTFPNLYELQNRLDLYYGISLEDPSSVYPNRVIIRSWKDTISSISEGGALPEEISKWPHNAGDDIAIHRGEHASELYNKLLNIYQTTAYGNYIIRLSAKALGKPFDSNMANHDQWHFDFSTDVNAGRQGMSSVMLYFKNGKLNKIRHEYNEADVYN